MKTVIITGASRGIGLAAAKKFLAEGWRVVGTFRASPIPINSENLVSINLDLASPESIARAAKDILKSAPHIDVLVNNAGIILDAHDRTADIEKIRQTLEVDLFGVVDLTEKLLSAMVPGSHIINIDSAYGAFSLPVDDETSTGYRLAKAALNMYTRILAFRMKTRHIIVSSLDPGWVKTDMGSGAVTGVERPDREPEEVAEEIYNLAVSGAETGQFWHKGNKRAW